jgi:hypothetical protein
MLLTCGIEPPADPAAAGAAGAPGSGSPAPALPRGGSPTCIWDVRKLASPVATLRPPRGEALLGAFFLPSDAGAASVAVLTADGPPATGAGVLRTYQARSGDEISLRPPLQSSKYLPSPAVAAAPLSPRSCLVLSPGGAAAVAAQSRRCLGVSREGRVAADGPGGLREAGAGDEVAGDMRRRAEAG